MVVDLEYGLSSGLISPHLLTVRAHGGATRLRTTGKRPGVRQPELCTPLVRASTPHGVSGRIEAGSHLGSTLKPGGAVLTLGVFRRSRSVACIRADASPSEVLAKSSWHPRNRRVKPNCHTVATTHHTIVTIHRPDEREPSARPSRRDWVQPQATPLWAVAIGVVLAGFYRPASAGPLAPAREMRSSTTSASASVIPRPAAVA